jgi:hypothetical protein
VTLDEAHKGLFAPIASAFDAAPVEIPVEVEVPEPAPSVRSEVSAPGPVRRRSGNMAAVIVPKPPAAEAKKALVLESDSERSTLPHPGLELVVEPPSSPSLSSTLEDLRVLANEGQTDEVFRRYATLLASSEFASSGPEAQREALRLMIFGNVSPAPSAEMRAAHRAALPLVQALVLEQRDAADYEMLGMAYLAVEEPEKATEMFKKALEIERTRDPASELCGSLMRRVSEL